MVNFKVPKSFKSPKDSRVLLLIVAALMLFYVVKTYSNRKTQYLSGFEPSQDTNLDASPVDTTDTMTGSLPNQDLLPPNAQQMNLLNPTQIIGMLGQVKRNQTYDLRGGIHVDKQSVPFNNSVLMEEDIRTTGMHGICS